MPDLRGTVAVVTGGNRGIGREIAFAFVAAGAAVAISARDEDALARTAREIADRGGDCLALACDVADPDAVEDFGSAVLERFGRTDTVVANAGIAGPTKPMHEIEPAEWDECVAINLRGVYLTFRRFIPEMIERAHGSLTAISSMTGKRPLTGRTPYAAAKMGVLGLVRTLAHEMGPHGIRVNSVCPGAVEGPRIAAVIANQARAQGIGEDEARSQLIAPAALKRLVAPSEVAAACLFLASDAGVAITGEDLNVSAGLVMY